MTLRAGAVCLSTVRALRRRVAVVSEAALAGVWQESARMAPIAVAATDQFRARLPELILGARLLLLEVIAFHVFYDPKGSDFLNRDSGGKQELPDDRRGKAQFPLTRFKRIRQDGNISKLLTFSAMCAWWMIIPPVGISDSRAISVPLGIFVMIYGSRLTEVDRAASSRIPDSGS
ncbi:hypothetical protein [Streptosporangium sp. V21-05]|uniref:hypothetical protein n=1 Tax=Streptosporangium sp. V21-05 TaxID=3446115 RepID=UPI003F53011F